MAFAAATAATAAWAAPAPAQTSAWSGWTASWENDSFAFFNEDRSDRLYTNGVRFTLARDPSSEWAWVEDFGEWWRLHLPGSLPEDPHTAASALVIGQNFFTPSVITDFDVDPRDRPFAGFTYAGLHVDVTEDPPADWVGAHVQIQHSFEVDVGVLGRPAFAEEVQSGVHVLRRSRIPKGWEHQVGFEPALVAGYLGRARMGWHFLDVVPHLGAMAGTVQTYAYGGVTARVGWNLSGFPALLIRPTAGPASGRRRWEVGLLAGVEGRAFAHNVFVDGSLFGGGPGVPSESLVGDFTFGGTLRLEDWRLSFTQVRRTPELSGDSPFAGVYQSYGSLSFTHEPGPRTPEDQRDWWVGRLVQNVLAPAFRRLELDVGLGQGSSTMARDVVPGGDLQGTAMRWGASVILHDRLLLGIEQTGQAREGGPPANAAAPHADVFLVNSLLTARVRPFGARGRRHILHLKGGWGSALRKVQVVPRGAGTLTQAQCFATTTLDDDARFCSREDEGSGVMLGAAYGYRLGRQASLGLDAAWHRLSLDDIEDEPEFVAITIGVRYHPGG
jgi:hypothetical protein